VSSPASGAVAIRAGEDSRLAGTLTIIRRAGMLAFAIQVAGAGLTYLQQVLLARLLGASDYGLYTYLYLSAGLAALIAGLGLPAAALRFIPAYRAAGEQRRVYAFTHTATLLTYATALLLAVGGASVALLLRSLGVLASPLPLILGALLVPALAGSILCTELARAHSRVGAAYAPPQVLRPALIGLAAGLAALAGHLSSTAALVATLGAAYVVLAVQQLVTGRRYRSGGAARREPGELTEWLGVGGSLVAVGAFVVVLMQVDVFIVGAIRGTREAGVYAAAAKTATLVSFVIFAVNAIAGPKYASLWAERRREELQRLVTRLAGTIFWPSLAIALGIAALSGPLLSLFGAGFINGRAALLILLAGQLVNAAAGSVGYLLSLTGHHRDAVRVLALSTVASLALTAAGAATFGLAGAAAGSACGFALWNVWMCRLVARRLGIRASILGGRP
jgi:O-antigen/teichoic acid export membrane protein